MKAFEGDVAQNLSSTAQTWSRQALAQTGYLSEYIAVHMYTIHINIYIYIHFMINHDYILEAFPGNLSGESGRAQACQHCFYYLDHLLLSGMDFWTEQPLVLVHPAQQPREQWYLTIMYHISSTAG